MKNLILTLIIILSLTCKAQTKIIGIDDYSEDITDGSYLKDIELDLNKFEGTWTFTNINTSLTIKLRKIVKYYGEDYYVDLLIGSYKYVENGVVVVDFLDRANDILIPPYNQYIVGSTILYKGMKPSCVDCEQLEKRVALSFRDPDLNRSHISGLGRMVLRYKNILGTEKLECKIFINGSHIQPDNAPDDFTVPEGDYILTKQ